MSFLNGVLSCNIYIRRTAFAAKYVLATRRLGFIQRDFRRLDHLKARRWNDLFRSKQLLVKTATEAREANNRSTCIPHQVWESTLFARERVAVIKRFDTLRRQDQESTCHRSKSIRRSAPPSKQTSLPHLNAPQSQPPRCWNSGIFGIPYFFLLESQHHPLALMNTHNQPIAANHAVLEVHVGAFFVRCVFLPLALAIFLSKQLANLPRIIRNHRF